MKLRKWQVEYFFELSWYYHYFVSTNLSLFGTLYKLVTIFYQTLRENHVKFLFMIAASVKSIMESTEKLCGGKVKLKVIVMKVAAN